MYKLPTEKEGCYLIALLLLLSQLGVDLDVLDFEIRIKAVDLLFAQVEALAEVLGSCLFYSILEVI